MRIPYLAALAATLFFSTPSNAINQDNLKTSPESQYVSAEQFAKFLMRKDTEPSKVKDNADNLVARVHRLDTDTGVCGVLYDFAPLGKLNKRDLVVVNNYALGIYYRAHMGGMQDGDHFNRKRKSLGEPNERRAQQYLGQMMRTLESKGK